MTLLTLTALSILLVSLASGVYGQAVETINYSDGGIYVGEVRNGQRNGQGAYTFADGRVDNGIWNNGEFVSADNIATTCFESDYQDCE